MDESDLAWPLERSVESHTEPFQWITDEPLTAHTSWETTATPESGPTFGVATTFHDEPSQCSTSDRERAAVCTSPTAQTSSDAEPATARSDEPGGGFMGPNPGPVSTLLGPALAETPVGLDPRSEDDPVQAVASASTTSKTGTFFDKAAVGRIST